MEWMKLLPYDVYSIVYAGLGVWKFYQKLKSLHETGQFNGHLNFHYFYGIDMSIYFWTSILQLIYMSQWLQLRRYSIFIEQISLNYSQIRKRNRMLLNCQINMKLQAWPNFNTFSNYVHILSWIKCHWRMSRICWIQINVNIPLILCRVIITWWNSRQIFLFLYRFSLSFSSKYYWFKIIVHCLSIRLAKLFFIKSFQSLNFQNIQDETLHISTE